MRFVSEQSGLCFVAHLHPHCSAQVCFSSASSTECFQEEYRLYLQWTSDGIRSHDTEGATRMLNQWVYADTTIIRQMPRKAAGMFLISCCFSDALESCHCNGQDCLALCGSLFCLNVVQLVAFQEGMLGCVCRKRRLPVLPQDDGMEVSDWSEDPNFDGESAAARFPYGT